MSNEAYAKAARSLITMASNAIEEACSYIEDVDDKDIKKQLTGELKAALEMGDHYIYDIETDGLIENENENRN